MTSMVGQFMMVIGGVSEHGATLEDLHAFNLLTGYWEEGLQVENSIGK